MNVNVYLNVSSWLKSVLAQNDSEENDNEENRTFKQKLSSFSAGRWPRLTMLINEKVTAELLNDVNSGDEGRQSKACHHIRY